MEVAEVNLAMRPASKPAVLNVLKSPLSSNWQVMVGLKAVPGWPGGGERGGVDGGVGGDSGGEVVPPVGGEGSGGEGGGGAGGAGGSEGGGAI